MHSKIIGTNGKSRLDLPRNSIKYFDVNIAGINIEIECIYGQKFGACKDYLAEFDIPDLLIETSMEDIENELINYPQLNFPLGLNSKARTATAITYNYADMETVSVQRKIADALPMFNTFLMHGSVVATAGKAYMFSAPSGIGKTTRTSIWLKEYPGSIVINGDKPYIQVRDDEIYACGTPWCGKEGWNTNISVSLKAIFLLERVDEGEKSSIQEVNLGQALPLLLKQIYMPNNSEAIEKTIMILKKLEKKVKIYRFRSEPTKKSINLAYETASS